MTGHRRTNLADPSGAASPAFGRDSTGVWRPAPRWDAGDPFFVEEGARGELLVARLRLLVVGAVAVRELVSSAASPARFVGLTLAGAALVVSFLLYVLARRVPRPWLGVASSAADVTLVSAGLAVSVFVDGPDAVVRSAALFDTYFLALACTSLRYDWRGCVLSGGFAIVQYLALLAAASQLAGGAALDALLDPGLHGARLALLAAAAAVATGMVLRARRLRRLSTTDRLTGVLNRGAFDERFAAEASRARRYERPLTLAIIDVDHFKRFNDAHGHAGGDIVLRVLADTFAASVRQSDTVARYGGEEFVLIFPETSAQTAIGRLEALRRVVAATPIDTGRGQSPVHVTVSIGLASWPEDSADMGEVLARADARLYEAKRLGRDRTAGPGPTS